MEEQDWRRGRTQMAEQRAAAQGTGEEEVEESEGEESLPEQCFYASFKIYLGPLEPASLGTCAEWSDQLLGKFIVLLCFFM